MQDSSFFISQSIACRAVTGHTAAWSLCPEEQYHCCPSIITLLLRVCFHQMPIKRKKCQCHRTIEFTQHLGLVRKQEKQMKSLLGSDNTSVFLHFCADWDWTCGCVERGVERFHLVNPAELGWLSQTRGCGNQSLIPRDHLPRKEEKHTHREGWLIIDLRRQCRMSHGGIFCTGEWWKENWLSLFPTICY